MDTIGARIKHLRESQIPRMSGAELARQVGIAGPSLWEIENGETKSLKATTLLSLCEVLHTTADFLLTGGASNGLPLAAMEAELLHAIRTLPAEKRLALMEYARFLVGPKALTKSQQPHAGKPAVVREIKQPRKHK